MQSLESLIEQFPTTYLGYEQVIEAINETRDGTESIQPIDENQLGEEFSSWISEDMLRHIVTTQEIDPEVSYQLVATPNLEVKSYKEFESIALYHSNHPEIASGIDVEDYWPHISFLDECCRLYTTEQLSGTNPSNGKSTLFSLIPVKLNNNKVYPPYCTMNGDIHERRFKLVYAQKQFPYLKTPSLLEVLTFWNTIVNRLANNYPENLNSINLKIVHFNLPDNITRSKYESNPRLFARVPFSRIVTYIRETPNIGHKPFAQYYLEEISSSDGIDETDGLIAIG